MTFAATHPRGERKVSRWLSRASGGALLRLCLPFEEICFALFHFLKAPCLGENKTARGKSLWRWSSKTVTTQSSIFNIFRTLHLKVDLLLLDVFETPQTERLSAFVTVLEVCGNVKGFFTGRPRGAASQARPAAESSPLVVLCIMKRDA